MPAAYIEVGPEAYVDALGADVTVGVTIQNFGPWPIKLVRAGASPAPSLSAPGAQMQPLDGGQMLQPTHLDPAGSGDRIKLLSMGPGVSRVYVSGV